MAAAAAAAVALRRRGGIAQKSHLAARAAVNVACARCERVGLGDRAGANGERRGL